MKYLKWLKWDWIITLVSTTVYSIYIYIDDGFSWMIVTQLAIVISAGPAYFNRNPRNSFRVCGIRCWRKSMPSN